MEQFWWKMTLGGVTIGAVVIAAEGAVVAVGRLIWIHQEKLGHFEGRNLKEYAEPVSASELRESHENEYDGLDSPHHRSGPGFAYRFRPIGSGGLPEGKNNLPEQNTYR